MNATRMTQVMKRTFTICLVTLGLFAGLALCNAGRGMNANAMMAAPQVLAAPVVTYNFTGYITYDRGETPHPAGTEVTGTFSYDAGNPNVQYLADGISAVYLGSPEYPMAMSIRVGTETWTFSDCHINLTNTSGNDDFTMIGHNSEGDDLHLRLRGPMFNSLALPTTLTGAFDKDFFIDDFPTGGGAVRVLGGNIDFLLPPVAQPPAITVASLTRTAGTLAALAQIATVSDAEDAPGSLAVTVNSPSVNGVSISGIGINSLGRVTATVGAACTASNASFTLRVTDSSGLFAEAPLNVTVAANPAPSLGNYPNATVAANAGATITPNSPPADNVSVSSLTMTAPGFTGTLTGNPVTGVITVAGANPPGNYTVSVIATDNCGATSTTTFPLAVTPLHNFSGFFQPVDNLPTVNRVNAGQAIPIKFSLGGNQGLNIFAAGYPISQATACDFAGGTSDIEETVTAGTSSLSYDAATDTYIYVWKTDKSWKGTCRQLVVKLNDGSTHVANFHFK